MNTKKNKIVFGAVLMVIVIFLVSYTLLIMGDGEKENEYLRQTAVPELQQEQEDYSTKLDAINDLREVRENNAPSIYDEKFMDSLGFYDPELLSKEKERIVDSIYNAGKINYSENSYRFQAPIIKKEISKTPGDTLIPELTKQLDEKKFGLEHQLFFASNPQKHLREMREDTDKTIHVVVDGNQTVKANYRLRMRLIKEALIDNRIIPKNTPIFGFISFKPNRAMIEIENINHYPVKLKAYDFQDGIEGIYIENSFSAEARREVVEDLVDDINVAGIPQVSGIKKIFQQSNRNVKVTVLNNYKLILKAPAGH